MSNSPVSLDIVGPTVDDDVRRLINRYGLEAVETAFRRRKARRHGRVPLKDWPKILPILQEDALLWLGGEDPFSDRRNYRIAADFAQKHPGQSDEATRRRIMKKLSQRRKFYTFLEAERVSRDNFSYLANLKALNALVEIGIYRDTWEELLRINEGHLADYDVKFGEPPASMSINEIRAEASRYATPTPATGNFSQRLWGKRPDRLG